MESTIYCLIDPGGRVFAGGGESYADVAAAAGLDEQACRQCRFDLATRRLIPDRSDSAGEQAARAFVDEHLGTPERLVTLAGEGYFPKRILASLLTAEKQPAYLRTCAVIEKQYTDDCRATNDPCLESGCAIDEEEICLQPLLRAGTDYDRACAAEWHKLFTDPGNRVAAWTR